MLTAFIGATQTSLLLSLQKRGLIAGRCVKHQGLSLYLWFKVQPHTLATCW